MIHKIGSFYLINNSIYQLVDAGYLKCILINTEDGCRLADRISVSVSEYINGLSEESFKRLFNELNSKNVIKIIVKQTISAI
jgi:hypothetical protein